MRARSVKLGAIGASIGLVLLASAVSPASAARPAGPVQTATTITSCSAFKGLVVTGSGVSGNLSLKAGDTITTTVTPVRTGDLINFTSGFTWYPTVATASGYTFTAATSGTYNLTWSLDTSANGGPPTTETITWKFDATCSSTAVSPNPTPTATTKPGKGKGK